jgi:hypothetical protein
MIESTQQMVWNMMMASVDFTTITAAELNTLFDTGIALGIFTQESLGLVAENLGTVWDDIETDAEGTKSSVLEMFNALNHYKFGDKSFTITYAVKGPGGLVSSVVPKGGGSTILQQAAGGFYNTSSPTLFETSEHGQNETAIFIPRGKTLYDVATPAQINNVMGGGGGTQQRSETQHAFTQGNIIINARIENDIDVYRLARKVSDEIRKRR